MATFGVLLNQDPVLDFLSNHFSGIYLFIRWRKVFDHFSLAIVMVIAMKSIVDKADDARFTLNQ